MSVLAWEGHWLAPPLHLLPVPFLDPPTILYQYTVKNKPRPHLLFNILITLKYIKCKSRTQLPIQNNFKMNKEKAVLCVAIETNNSESKDVNITCFHLI